MFGGPASSALVPKKWTYPCHKCDKTFNRQYNQERHMKFVHKVPKNLKNPAGNMAVFVPKNLREEERTFPCNICDKIFSRKYNRDKHMELVHKVPRPDHPPLFPEILKKATEEKKTDSQKKPVEKNDPENKSEPAKKSLEKNTDLQKKPTEKKLGPENKPEPAKNTAEKNPQKKLKKIVSEKKPVKTVSLKRPTNESPDSPAKKVKLAYQNGDVKEILLDNETKSRPICMQYCGNCGDVNKHKYVIAIVNDNLTLAPICVKCNELNITFYKPLLAFQKKEICEKD